LSLGASWAIAESRHTGQFAEARPQEEPDGEPDRGGAEVLRGVVRRHRGCRAGCIFTDDAVYHNIPLTPVTGREDIANTISSFIRPGPPGIEGIEFRVINIAADGPVVLTERVDVFRLSDKSFELPVMGAFEVSDGKINAWRDYFDMNQFTSQME
jgi:limonene-1,2-epoxide hydrolase